ncbi:glucose-6-phosphate isomerase [Micromonospora sp. NPDC092111]|uniref:glucose-6-phosphate isomerase n=1 Tax=Micromonospora sp. NPDC092111 TaxID=3364289 RepID=UPI003803CFA1
MSDLLTGPADAAAGLAVHGADAVEKAAPASVRAALVARGFPAALAAQDPTLWGPAAEERARSRLGWLDTHRRSRELLPQLAELTAELVDLDHVVLAGTGGVPLAAAAAARTLGRPLTVLDSTDPGRVRATLADRLDRTVVVLAGGSGTAVTADSHRRTYWQAFLDAGMTEAEAARHFVVVADPGSPLAEVAEAMGVLVVPADPRATGRHAALTACGLVPAALAGVPVADLLDDAEAFAASLGQDRDNPALALGAALAVAADTGRRTVALIPDGTGLDGLGDWIAHLLAGPTGLLPVPVESPTAPGATGPGVLAVSYGGALTAGDVPGGGGPDLAVLGPLGAHFLAWRYAAAVLAAARGVDPFEEPDDARSAAHTRRILESGPPPQAPTFTEGAVEVYAPPGGPADLDGVLRGLVDGLTGDGHLAVTAYLDRVADADAARLRPLLAAAAGRPVTFGWGPGCRHSTAKCHETGAPVGGYLQLTGAIDVDLPVPGRPYSLGQLQAAQAAGDRSALADQGRPVLRLHLTDRPAGLAQLLDAIGRWRA